MRSIGTAIGLALFIGVVMWQADSVVEGLLLSIAFMLFVLVLEISDIAHRVKKLSGRPDKSD